MALAIAAVSTAKDIKTVVLTTNLDDKTVVIEYDADKTNVQSIIEGFKKIKYDACEVKGDSSSQVDAETGATKK